MQVFRRIQPRPADARVPLTAIQAQMWSYMREHGNVSLRTCASTIRIVGKLDAALLERCIGLIVRRHESLRTRIAEVDGLAQQFFDEAEQFELVTVDLSNSTHPLEDKARQLIHAFCAEKVDLTRGPLFAARLFKLSQTDHVLVCALDHMISDGTSLGILDTDVWTAYRQAADGLPILLPPLSAQFGDYCVWQEDNYISWREQHQEYWRARLHGAPELRIPRTGACGDSSSCTSESRHFPLGKHLSERLCVQAERDRVPVAWLLLAVYAVVMSRWCNQQDVLLTFVSHARYRDELRPMIGFVASYVYVRLHVPEAVALSSIVREIKRQMFLAVQHEDFGRVTGLLSEWGVPYTEGYFNWLPNFGAQRPFDFGQTGAEEFELRPFPFRVPIPADFFPLFYDSAEEIVLIVDFKPSVFPHSVVEEFAIDIASLAEEFLEHTRLSSDEATAHSISA